MQSVGLTIDQLNEIVRQRLQIEKYIDFRFRSFTVVTPKEIESYYRESYVPRARNQRPGVIIKTLEEASEEIRSGLISAKIESEIDAFKDSIRDHAEIVIIKPL
jgi:hypothetical protein